jgi:hypothetical protein
MGDYGGGGLMLDRASQGATPGWRGWPEAVGNSGARSDSSDTRGEEGADMWGPHVSDRGERRRHSWKAQTEGESAFMRRRHGACGPARPAGEAAAREGEWADTATWAEWARMKEEFKIRFDFQISINFGNLARL